MRSQKRLNIIYDGQCGFCVRALNVVSALDTKRVFSFYDANQQETFERFTELRGADTSEAMYTLAEGELPHRGFYAFRRLIWSSVWMWPLIPLFYFPGATFFGPRTYAWI